MPDKKGIWEESFSHVFGPEAAKVGREIDQEKAQMDGDVWHLKQLQNVERELRRQHEIRISRLEDQMLRLLKILNTVLPDHFGSGS